MAYPVMMMVVVVVMKFPTIVQLRMYALEHFLTAEDINKALKTF
jgi:hypothetical protein